MYLPMVQEAAAASSATYNGDESDSGSDDDDASGGAGVKKSKFFKATEKERDEDNQRQREERRKRRREMDGGDFEYAGSLAKKKRYERLAAEVRHSRVSRSLFSLHLNDSFGIFRKSPSPTRRSPSCRRRRRARSSGS